MSMYPGPMHHPQYYHPLMYPHHQAPPVQQAIYDPSMQQTHYTQEVYASDQYEGVGWTPGGTYEESSGATPAMPGTPSAHAIEEVPTPTSTYPPNPRYAKPPTPAAHADGDRTPYKYNPGSPYWGHLDHTTLAMMGIGTPQGMTEPQTPSRGLHSSPESHAAARGEDTTTASVNAQPLLLRQYPSYGYYGNREGYGPPSPATQFMMSPQGNFGYAYGSYSGLSPNRITSSSQTSPLAPTRDVASTSESGVPGSLTTPSKVHRDDSANAGEMPTIESH